VKKSIGPPEQNDQEMLLFALLVDEMGKSFKNVDEVPPPGILRMWGISGLTLDDLKVGISSNEAPKKWPAWFHEKNRWSKLRGRPFLQSLLFAIEKGRYFGVSSANEILSLMESVAQTFFTKDGRTRKRNHSLADGKLQRATQELKKRETAAEPQVPIPGELKAEPLKSSAEPRPQLIPRSMPWPEVEDRRDENEGGSLFLAERYVTWASHVGPEFAQKNENQDAAHVIANDNWITFALADGVGTSFGSRFAAAAIVHRFCRDLQEALADERDAYSALSLAAQSTHNMLDEILDHLLANRDAPEWAQVGGQSKLQRDVVIRLAENTRTPKNRAWGPVLAATLIGGAVKVERGGSLRATLMRIGDGVVEQTAVEEDTPLFAMNSEETEIECSMSPGPQSGHAIAKLQAKTVVLGPADGLIVSSDGLTRGHSGSFVRVMLEEIMGRDGLRPSPETPALEVLKRAVAYSQEKFNRDSTTQLFADNLSLIVFSSVAVKGVQSGQERNKA